MNKIKYNFNKTEFFVSIRNDVDLSVFNEIFKYREYKACEEILKNAIYPILDVGAHAGFFSIYANCFNKNIKIYAIEPEKNNLEFLKLHKKENDIDNIKIIECAIAGESRVGELIVSEDSINHHISQIHNFTNSQLKENPKNEIQKIKILSLKDLLDQNKIKKVSLLKMDIEGGEYEIFKNIEHKTLDRIENIILEYHLGSEQVGRLASEQVGEQVKYDEKFLENILRENKFSVQIFPSQFDKSMGFIFARNKNKK